MAGAIKQYYSYDLFLLKNTCVCIRVHAGERIQKELRKKASAHTTLLFCMLFFQCAIGFYFTIFLLRILVSIFTSKLISNFLSGEIYFSCFNISIIFPSWKGIWKRLHFLCSETVSKSDAMTCFSEVWKRFLVHLKEREGTVALEPVSLFQ